MLGIIYVGYNFRYLDT